PEPARLRLRRWVRRHQAPVSSAAAAILVVAATGSYLLYEGQMGRVRRQVEANARVDALSTAEVRALPQIVEQLGADRALVRDRVGGVRWGGGSASGKIGAGLALLPGDPSRARPLFARAAAPDATPDEVLVIREGLARYGALEPFAEPIAKGLRPPSEPLD